MKMVFVSLPVLSPTDNNLLMSWGAALRKLVTDAKKLRIFRAASMNALTAITSLVVGISCTIELVPEQLSQGRIFTEPTFESYRSMLEKVNAGNYALNAIVSSPDYAHGFFRYCVLHDLCDNEPLMGQPITSDRLLVFDSETRLFSFIEKEG